MKRFDSLQLHFYLLLTDKTTISEKTIRYECDDYAEEMDECELGAAHLRRTGDWCCAVTAGARVDGY